MGVVLTLCFVGLSPAEPLGTVFTYQGRLIDANSTADALYDFQFKLYDASVAGAQKGSTINNGEVDVIDGYFTVALDFGSSVFNGDARWLEIGVRPGAQKDPNVYTVLLPRQQVAPTPYALYADMLDGLHASSFISTGSDYGRSGASSNLYEGTTPLTDPCLASTYKGCFDDTSHNRLGTDSEPNQKYVRSTYVVVDSLREIRYQVTNQQSNRFYRVRWQKPICVLAEQF